MKYVPLTDPLTCPFEDASICCSGSTNFPFDLFSSPDLLALSDSDDLDDFTDDREFVRLRLTAFSETSSVSSVSSLSSDMRSDAKSMPLFDKSFGAPCVSTLPWNHFGWISTKLMRQVHYISQNDHPVSIFEEMDLMCDENSGGASFSQTTIGTDTFVE